MFFHQWFPEYLLREEVHRIKWYTLVYLDRVVFKTSVAILLGSEPHARGRRLETEEARQDHLLPHVWEASEDERFGKWWKGFSSFYACWSW